MWNPETNRAHPFSWRVGLRKKVTSRDVQLYAGEQRYLPWHSLGAFELSSLKAILQGYSRHMVAPVEGGVWYEQERLFVRMGTS